MRMGPHVDRHPIDELCEVSTVVEVETAQKILIGLSTAGMLGCNEAWDDLQQFCDPLDRAVFKVRLTNLALRRRGRNTDKIFGPACDDDVGCRLVSGREPHRWV